MPISRWHFHRWQYSSYVFIPPVKDAEYPEFVRGEGPIQAFRQMLHGYTKEWQECSACGKRRLVYVGMGDCRPPDALLQR